MAGPPSRGTAEFSPACRAKEAPLGSGMYQFVYVSSETNRFTDAQLKELLEVSRRKNNACGVTGLLLYVSGNFIQLLEGAKEDVLATCARIAEDPRHRGMNTLLEGACERRDFEDWSMGFEKVEGAEAGKLPGYSDFLARKTDQAAERSSALRLLEFFKELNLPGGKTIRSGAGS